MCKKSGESMEVTPLFDGYIYLVFPADAIWSFVEDDGSNAKLLERKSLASKHLHGYGCGYGMVMWQFLKK